MVIVTKINGGKKMGLSNKQEEHLKKMPYIETRIEKSKDGKFIINRTIITNVRPVAYYEAVLQGETADSAVEAGEVDTEKIET